MHHAPSFLASRGGGGGSRIFAVGQRVLAKFENSAEYFDGIVDSINRNGTVVVAFDDGDIDRSVPRHNIVHLAAAGVQAQDGNTEGARPTASRSTMITLSETPTEEGDAAGSLQDPGRERLIMVQVCAIHVLTHTHTHRHTYTYTQTHMYTQ